MSCPKKNTVEVPVSDCAQKKKTEMIYSNNSKKMNPVSPRLNSNVHTNESFLYDANSFDNRKLLNESKRNNIRTKPQLTNYSLNQFKTNDRKMNQSKFAPKNASHLLSNKERERCRYEPIADSRLSRKNERNNNSEINSNRTTFNTNINRSYSLRESRPRSMFDPDPREKEYRRRNSFDSDKSGTTFLYLSDSLNRCKSSDYSHRSIIDDLLYPFDESSKYSNDRFSFNQRDRNHLNDLIKAYTNDSSFKTNNSQYKRRRENIDNINNQYQFGVPDRSHSRSDIDRSSSFNRPNYNSEWNYLNDDREMYSQKEKLDREKRHSDWGITRRGNKELENKITSLYSEINQSERENDRLKIFGRENKDLKDQIKCLNSRTEELNEQISINNSLNNEMSKSKMQIKDMEKEMIHLNKEFKESIDESKSLRLEMNEIKRENNELRLSDMRDKELKKEMNAKETELDKQIRVNISLNDKIEKIENRMKDLQVMNERKSLSEREMLKTNELLNSKNKETEMEIGRLNGKLKELINENKSLSTEMNELKKENDDLKLKQLTLDSKTKNDYNSMNTEIRDLKKQIEESKLYSGGMREYQNIIKENQLLSSKCQDYEREIRELKMVLTSETEELEKEINSLKGKINEQEKQINRDNKLISGIKLLVRQIENNKLLSLKVKILESQIDCFKCSDKELLNLRNKELERLIEEETMLTRRIRDFDKKIEDEEFFMMKRQILEEEMQSEKLLIARFEDLERECSQFYNNVPPVMNGKQSVKIDSLISRDNESKDEQKDTKWPVSRLQSERRYKRNTHSDPDRRSTWGFEKMPHGFNNPKGYCFLNSVVQLLYSCSEFVQNLKKSVKTNIVTKEKETFFYNFSKLIEAMDKNNYGNVTEFVSKIQDFFIESSTGDDVHACYMKILTILLEVTKTSDKSEKSVTQDNSDSKTCFENFRQQNNGFIFDLFYGQMCQQVICTKCNNVFTSSHQLFKSIPLPVPKDDGEYILTDLIKMFLQKSVVEADHTWQGKCSGSCENVYSCTMLTHVPKYLFIYLNRGSYFNDGVKNNTFIYSDMELEISVGRKGEKYRLISTIDHIGNSDGGHYYARSCYGTGQWWLLNDTQVGQINPNNEIVTKNTIVFLFKKCEDSKYS